MHIGVISDTHGLLRPEAVEALKGSKLILHAGDVGSWEVLRDLRRVAPVVAVRGNVDTADWARWLKPVEVAEFSGLSFYILHKLSELDLKPEAADMAAVLYGHSHRPSIEWHNGVLRFNPGSAGPRRFDLPVTVGRIRIVKGELKPEIITLFE
ncbi:MAG: metallophosphoesterase family protein [Acidobacteriota bacterium]|nr:metallophosphoesterase family protein [Acidobacteriota bacterium]